VEKRGLTDQLQAVGASQGSVIAWGDEMRFGLITQVRRVWAQRGFKPVCRMQMVREWGYLALAVDGPGGKLYWTWQTNMKKESCAQTMQTWQQAGVATLIWDGARGHHAALTRAVEVKQIIRMA
jgi:hypothetical protein